MLNITSATPNNTFEIVSLKFKEGITFDKQQNMMESLNAIVKNHSGFKSRDYFYSEDNQHWIDILVWDNKDSAKKATNEIGNNPDAGVVFSQIDEHTLMYSHFQLMGGGKL